MEDVPPLHPWHKERQLGVAGNNEGFAVRQADKRSALALPPSNSATLGKLRG